MIRKLRIENFLSIGEEIEFNMFSGNYKINMKNRLIDTNHDSLLKISAIYGHNGSGKSNFVRAILFLRSLVIKGTKDIKEKINITRNKLSGNWSDKPTKFKIEFYYKDMLYFYKIVINKNIIEEESLHHLLNNKKNIIFTRVTNNYGKSNLKFEKKKQMKNKDDLRRQIYQEELRPNQPFIREGYNKKIKEISNAYRWFYDILQIVTPKLIYPSIIQKIAQEKPFKKLANKFIQSIDIGINEIDVKTYDLDNFFGKEGEEAKNKILEKIDKNTLFTFTDDEGNLVSAYYNKNIPEIGKLVFKHMSTFNDLIEFDLVEESDGTKRFVDLIPALIFASKNKVFIIDELDRSLHPQLVEKYILSFFNLIDKSSKGQFIFTTHCDYIMNLKLFRQDEIWFMANQDGNSKLYPLSDYNVRYDKDIRRAYMHGIFGANPDFTGREL